MKRQLELKDIVGYPKGVEGIEVWDKENLQVANICSIHYSEGTVKTNSFFSKAQPISSIEPILKPMTEEFMAFVLGHEKNTAERMAYFIEICQDNYRNCPKWIIDLFHKHHIDYQELIEEGLAIDETTLKTK